MTTNPLLAVYKYAAAWNIACPTLVVFLLEGDEPLWQLQDPPMLASTPASGSWSLMFWHVASPRAFYRREEG